MLTLRVIGSFLLPNASYVLLYMLFYVLCNHCFPHQINKVKAFGAITVERYATNDLTAHILIICMHS